MQLSRYTLYANNTTYNSNDSFDYPIIQWSAVVKVKEDGQWSSETLKNKLMSGSGRKGVGDLEKVMNFENGDLVVITSGDYTSAVS